MASGPQQQTHGEPKQKFQPKEETEFQKLLNKGFSYKPYGEPEEISLDPRTVYQFVAQPTRGGHMPSMEDCARFCMLCKTRELNPFAGDAWLLGYDTKDGPKFECITAVAALLKRAERNPDFDGMQMGVILQGIDGAPVFREGDFVGGNETLLGGWCKVYRRDRKFPFYSALKLGAYKKNHGRWNDDAAGMIVKCAKAAALRNAFPTQLGGLYLREERDYDKGEYVDASDEVRGTRGATSRVERVAAGLQQETPDESSQHTEEPSGTEAPVADTHKTAGRKKKAESDPRLVDYSNAIHACTDVATVERLREKYVTNVPDLPDDEARAGNELANWKIKQLAG